MKWKKEEQPFECAYCSRFFVSKRYFIMSLRTGEEFGICEKCLLDILCDSCGKKLHPHELYVEECSICDQIYVVCKDCHREKRPLFTRLKEGLKRMLYRLGLTGVFTAASVVQCCLKKKDGPLKFSNIIYFRNGAQEGTDREKDSGS
jgi:hypothetical protein